MADTEIFLDGFSFTEGLRWYQNQLWFCDVWAHAVYCFDLDGTKVNKIDIDDKPVGLGWLSDGSLLITSLMKRQLLRWHDNKLSVFASLDFTAPGYGHDFTVTGDDFIYLSASGFYPAFEAVPVKSNVFLIAPDKHVTVAASGLGYPNGIVVTPNKKNIIVAETFSSSVLMLEINDNHALVNPQTWARFDELGFEVQFDPNGVPVNLDRHYPDGICFDNKLNAVWVASPGKNQVLCVAENNTILHTIHTVSRPFDCVLGGGDSRTLYIASSDMSETRQTGKIECVVV